MDGLASDFKAKTERATRFAIPMAVRFREPGEENWHDGKVENISRTGILFLAEQGMGLSAAVEMTFQLPAKIKGRSAAQVLCVGNVVRTVLPPSSDQPLAVAARFHSYKLIQPECPPAA